MASPFIYPSITSLPAGYDCIVAVPTARLARRTVRDGAIRVSVRVFYEGEIVHAEDHTINVRDRQPTGNLPQFHWRDHGSEWNGKSGFFELSFRSENGELMFSTPHLISFYSIYSKAGKKSFFSDNAFRYGSPTVINQIASFGKYVDAYPVVHLDRKRDLGETVTLINPYKKPVRAKLMTYDGRELRERVNPDSVVNIRLAQLLRDDEDEWLGQLQLTATNRLVTFHIKHSMVDPAIISDHEHLDPFRDDATHMPLTQMMRLRWGMVLRKRGLIE